MAKKEKSTLDILNIEIEKNQKLKIGIPVQSLSGLLMHNFSNKAKSNMLGDHTGLAPKLKVKDKPPKDLIQEFVGSIYFINPRDKKKVYKRVEATPWWKKMVKVLEKGEAGTGEWEDGDVTKCFKNVPIGFPAMGFKLSAVQVARTIKGLPMKLVNQLIFVEPDYDQLVLITPKKIVMKNDYVRLQGTTADQRIRALILDWKAVLRISFNQSNMSADIAAHLFETAGDEVGIGDWRPQRNGIYGKYEITKTRTRKKKKK